MTRLVVTGASGNVGVALLRRLARSGADYHVTALARNPPGSTGVAGNGEMPVEWKAVDIRRDDLVTLFRGADVVVHLAWRFHPTRDVRETWRDNVLGSEWTFDAAVWADVPALVYASSVCAYSPGPQTTGEPEVPVEVPGRTPSRLVSHWTSGLRVQDILNCDRDASRLDGC
jgi:UDP-glucose 4-epimerase